MENVLIFVKLKNSNLEYHWSSLGWCRDGALWGEIKPLPVPIVEVQNIVDKCQWCDGHRQKTQYE